MQPTDIVSQVVQILVAGITQLGQGIGSGVNSFVTALAFTGTGSDQTLSIYFIMVLVMCGIGLAVGLTSKLFQWLSSLGN